MGGGKDQKQANQMLQSQSRWEQGQRDSFGARNEKDLDASRGRADDVYSSLRSGYQSIYDNAKAAGGSGSGGGGGGFSAPGSDPRFGEVQDQYRHYMKTGGWDPDRVASQDSNIQRLKSIGYDPDTVNRMRGGGVFDEFARTGGVSDADKANLRARGNSVIPSFYGSMRDEGARLSSVQGGYGPGRMAMMSRLARQQAAGAQDAARDTELGITDRVNEGRRWGSGAMSDAEGRLGSLRVGSLGAASDVERQMVDSINQGKQWGTGGLHGMAESDRSFAASSAAQGAAADRWAQEFELRKQLAGLGGLESLYGSSPTEYMQNKEFGLSNRGLSSDSVGDLSTRLKSGNKSWSDYVGGITGGVGAWV
jgi:hypothetical protein